MVTLGLKSGTNPSWLYRSIPDHPQYPGNWARPAFNGVALMDFVYCYAPGTNHFQEVTPPIQRLKSASSSLGDCISCGNNSCTIKITDQSGQIYTKDFADCPSYSVNCDEECPPGHLRCSSNKYPGYCCIPCAALASQINSMRARL